MASSSASIPLELPQRVQLTSLCKCCSQEPRLVIPLRRLSLPCPICLQWGFTAKPLAPSTAPTRMLTVIAPTARFQNLAPATSYSVSAVCIQRGNVRVPALSPLTIRTPDLG